PAARMHNRHKPDTAEWKINPSRSEKTASMLQKVQNMAQSNDAKISVLPLIFYTTLGKFKWRRKIHPLNLFNDLFNDL
ncbi:MAG: hypothetical protein ACK5WZ_03130, partial [Pseudobdellovibrionaceae bacterium]